MHDIKCKECGKKATIALEEATLEYEITEKGEYNRTDIWEDPFGCRNLCQKCYDEEFN